MKLHYRILVFLFLNILKPIQAEIRLVSYNYTFNKKAIQMSFEMDKSTSTINLSYALDLRTKTKLFDPLREFFSF